MNKLMFIIGFALGWFIVMLGVHFEINDNKPSHNIIIQNVFTEKNIYIMFKVKNIEDKFCKTSIKSEQESLFEHYMHPSIMQEETIIATVLQTHIGTTEEVKDFYISSDCKLDKYSIRIVSINPVIENP